MTQDEQMLLGQMVINQDVFYHARMIQEDFTTREAKIIFDGIRNLEEKGTRPDIVNLCQTCPAVKSSTIAALTDVPTAENWKHYATRVKDAGMRKRIIELLGTVKEKAEEMGPAETLTRLQHGIDKIGQRQQQYEIKRLGEEAANFMNKVEDRYKSKSGNPGINTGFFELDKATMGFQSQRLIIIGARPSDGKSAIMKDIALHMAQRGTPVGVISTESDVTEFLMRTYSGLTPINSQSLIAGRLKGAEQFADLTKTSAAIYEIPLYIYDQPNPDLETIIMIARRLVNHYGVKALFIDYLQNVRHKDRNMPRNLQVAEISAAFKELTREYKIPVVAMAQLKRPSDHKPRPPIMSDLGESKNIEQDADTVIMIHHDQDQDDNKVGSYLYIRKNRDGPKTRIPVRFEPHFIRFVNYYSGPVEGDETPEQKEMF